jgi:hypothetical protein
MRKIKFIIALTASTSLPAFASPIFTCHSASSQERQWNVSVELSNSSYKIWNVFGSEVVNGQPSSRGFLFPAMLIPTLKEETFSGLRAHVSDGQLEGILTITGDQGHISADVKDEQTDAVVERIDENLVCVAD